MKQETWTTAFLANRCTMCNVCQWGVHVVQTGGGGIAVRGGRNQLRKNCGKIAENCRKLRTSIPLCDIPSGCCSFTGPWTVTRSSLRMLRRVATFCRPLWPVLLLVSFPLSRSPVVGVLGLCWMRHGVPFACQRRPIVGVLRMCWLLSGSFDCFCCPHTSVHRPSIACLAVFLCVVPSTTRCPGRPPYAPFPLTAGLPLMGSHSCCANSPSGLWETPPT